MMFFGIEAGGTKFNCAVGRGDSIVASTRVPTTTPDETLSACVEFFRSAAVEHGAPEGIGIATFGPVGVHRDATSYGHILNTPKPHWSGADLLTPFHEAFGCSIAIDTDVNGAAMGEHAFGAGRGLDTFVYITVGTGIGGGAIVNGAPLRGALHTEMGHVLITRHAVDDFPGTCPYHSNCVEGLACGPAISQRWGRSSHDLGEHLEAAVSLESRYLAAAFATIVATLAPQRIIVGGGVMELPGLFDATRLALSDVMNGYPGAAEHTDMTSFLVPPALGGSAGMVGALVLAEQAT